jgi:hypothetical protein
VLICVEGLDIALCFSNSILPSCDVFILNDFRRKKKFLEMLQMTWQIECVDIHYVIFRESMYVSATSSSKVIRL